ncbi:MAG: hypothetical protein IKJ58_01565 [Akkermansia sp.]|nr:hypothetical protein [Akkermansia sp.]
MFKKLLLTPLLFLGLLSTITTVSAAAPVKADIEISAKPDCSPLGNRLMALPETYEGIKQRLALITEEMNAHPELYHLGSLPEVDYNRIALRLVETSGAAGILRSQHSSMSHTVRFTMSINLLCNDEQTSERKAEMHMVDTIAHELAHCYFHMRYTHLRYNEPADHLIIEGVAMHIARAFLQHHFPDHTCSSSKTYGDHYVSDAYAMEYRKFVNKYTDHMGNINWAAIDQRECSRAPHGHVIRDYTQANAVKRH